MPVRETGSFDFAFSYRQSVGMTANKATKAQPYTPAEGFDGKTPLGLAFGVRTIFVTEPEGERQYLVFKTGFDANTDPDCNHVLGSGFTFEHACESAARAMELLQKKPSDYWPRLEGCSFASEVEQGRIALQHTVLDAEGAELGRADYREEAAKLAMRRILPQVEDPSFEEFLAIATPVRLDRSGRGTYGSVFADDVGRGALDKELASIYRCCPSARQAAEESLKRRLEGDLREHSAETADIILKVRSRSEGFAEFKSMMTKSVLSAFGKMKADASVFRLSVEGDPWKSLLILHTGRLSERELMRGAYEEFLAEQRELLREKDVDSERNALRSA